MGQIIRCPLIGTPCMKEITVQEKTFFLAEAEKPERARQRRIQAINEAIGDGYEIRSALEEKGINAFGCKICEMIQTCAYGMADISEENPNVLLELGMMIALGKPTIILLKQEQDEELKLFSDLKAIEVIPFTEYIDIIDQLRGVVHKLPSPVLPPSPIQDLEKIEPKFAQELKRMELNIVREFKSSIRGAKLDKISISEEEKDVSPELSEKLKTLEGQLENMNRLGITMDAEAASLKGNYLHYMGNYEEALASFNLSLELRPNDPDTLTHRAEINMHLGRYKEAIVDCNRALEIKPNSDEALDVRGSAYALLEKHKKALADFNHSLELSPDDPIALFNRGSTYVELERYNEALADFNRSLELRPDDPDTLYNLACLFSLWGKPDDALTYLEKAIKGDEKYREDAKTDEDFNNIQDNPNFKQLTE